jgi:hypothetical protein
MRTAACLVVLQQGSSQRQPLLRCAPKTGHPTETWLELETTFSAFSDQIMTMYKSKSCAFD